MGAGQTVVRHRQADVVVVAVRVRVVGPAYGQDVILRQRVLGKVVMADDSPVSVGKPTWISNDGAATYGAASRDQ